MGYLGYLFYAGGIITVHMNSTSSYVPTAITAAVFAAVHHFKMSTLQMSVTMLVAFTGYQYIFVTIPLNRRRAEQAAAAAAKRVKRITVTPKKDEQAPKEVEARLHELAKSENEDEETMNALKELCTTWAGSAVIDAPNVNDVYTHTHTHTHTHTSVQKSAHM